MGCGVAHVSPGIAVIADVTGQRHRGAVRECCLHRRPRPAGRPRASFEAAGGTEHPSEHLSHLRDNRDTFAAVHVPQRDGDSADESLQLGITVVSRLLYSFGGGVNSAEGGAGLWRT